MKYLKFAFAIMLMAGLSLTFTNCKNQASTDQQSEETVGQSGPEYASAYICPMHCKGSGSATPGNCPVCGMEYEKNMDHEMHMHGDNHEADHEMDHEDMTTPMYACSMHPEVTGQDGDKCSKCGMDLTPIEGEDHSGHNH